MEGAMCVFENTAVEAVEKEAFGRGFTVLESGKSLLRRLRLLELAFGSYFPDRFDRMIQPE